ncbi:MAG: glycosyltransferase [bacterium]
MRSPTVSIVIPLYNNAAYIERALGSVQRQTLQDFEVIVVDDGSTDGSGELAAAVADPRIRVLRQENQGVSAARNRGIEEARGELVAFLDADDEWLAGFLAAVGQLHALFPQAGICCTGYTVFEAGGSVREVVLRGPPEPRLIRRYFRHAADAYFVWTSCVAVPRKVFQEVGCFPEGEPIGEDLDLWGRIALRFPVACRPEILAICHEEAAGRSSLRHAASPPHPPFVRTARALLAAGELEGELAADVKGYLNRLLIDHAKRLIRAGRRDVARQLLRSELHPPVGYHLERAAVYAGALGMPMDWLSAVGDTVRRLKGRARRR